MSDDTTVPDSEQPSLDSLLADLTSDDIGVRFYATNTLQRMATDLARQATVLCAQVAAHEDADRRWSADMAALRETLNAATPRLEAYGAIAHVVLGTDSATPDDVVAACTELPFVRIENKRLRDELAELRRELRATQEDHAQTIADRDARSGEPL